MSDERHTIASICVGAQASLREVLKILGNSPLGICLVVDENRQILGTVTDGDCRRALLKSNSLDLSAQDVMHREFLVVDETFSLDQIRTLMRSNGVDQIPIVNRNNQVIDLVTSTRVLKSHDPNVVAVILAGGKGKRLMPLTEAMPKPMLPVGDKPMLERLIDQLVSQGIKDIYISISYLGHIIQEHFGDGEKFGCSIKYITETKELGTAGPLRALREMKVESILVVNGDLVTSVDFNACIELHQTGGHDLTVGVSRFDYQIPFGVVSTNAEGVVTAIREKPSFSFTINAGFYAVQPHLLELIPEDVFFPMNEFIEATMRSGHSVGAFAVHENWADVGLMDQYLQLREPRKM